MKGLFVIMLLSVLEPHDLVVITGVRGSGKSSTAKKLIAVNLNAGRRIVAWDPKDEYSRLGRKRKSVELGPLRDRVTLDELLANPEMLDAEDLSLAVVPSNPGTEEPDELAADFKELAGQVRLTGDLMFVVDEVGLIEEDARKTLKIVGTQSRHWGDEGVPLVLIAQRMVLITRSARDMSSIIYTGVQTDPDDLRTLYKLVVARLGEEKAQAFITDVATQPMPGVREFRRDAKSPKPVANPSGGDT